MHPTKHAKSILCLAMVIFLMTLNAPLSAKGNHDPRSGFSGRINVGMKVSISENQGSDEVIQTLNDNGNKSDTDVFPIISGKLSYTLEEAGTKFHIEKKRSQQVNLGVGQPFAGIGTIDLTLTYARGSVWKNPYLLHSERDETTKTTSGCRLSWDGIMETRARASYLFSLVDIEDDGIGRMNEKLRRNGWIHTVNSEYPLFVNRTNFFTPGVSVTRKNADGEAFSYHGVKVGTRFTHINPSFMVNMDLFFNRKRFDDNHPTFSKTREDQSLDTRLVVTKFNVLGVTDVNVNLFAGYCVVDSNIGFYDSRTITTGIELEYRF